MPDIEITEECRALIAAEFPFEETWRRLPNGKWVFDKFGRGGNIEGYK